MAIFRLRSQSSPSLLKLRWKLPLFCGGSLAVLVASFYLNLHLDHWSRSHWVLRELLFFVPSLALVATVVGFLLYFRLPSIQRKAREQEYEITGEGVFRRYPGLPDLFVPASQITSFEMRKTGLLLRLQDRPKAMLVPAELIGFEEIPGLLMLMGVPKAQPGRYRLLGSLLKFLAYLAGAWFCGEVLFLSKDPLRVGIAGVCYVAIMSILTFRQGNSPYQGPGARSQRWLQPLTLVLWFSVVAIRLWTVTHPHPHRGAHQVYRPTQPPGDSRSSDQQR